jgi:hypothetical protein
MHEKLYNEWARRDSLCPSDITGAITSRQLVGSEWISADSVRMPLEAVRYQNEKCIEKCELSVYRSCVVQM